MKFFSKNKKFLIFASIFVILILVVVSADAYSESNDFCNKCHIMEDAYERYKEDIVHADLTCSDCHNPKNSAVDKYVYKASSGLGHLYSNTFGSDIHPNEIIATEETRKIIETNCFFCHEQDMEEAEHIAIDGNCITCHEPHNSLKNALKLND